MSKNFFLVHQPDSDRWDIAIKSDKNPSADNWNVLAGDTYIPDQVIDLTKVYGIDIVITEDWMNE